MMSAHTFIVERRNEKKSLSKKEGFSGSIHFPNALYEPLVRQPCQQEDTCSSKGFPFGTHLLKNTMWNAHTLGKDFQR